ncbi:hypothetical protein ACFQY5_41555 [Paeniroseomonas aquatica]|uniref:hypothetical protein n=1 Tax=Paeniroseomonas aquatica TaxID=373043 RepID=UPI0036187447
MDGDRDVCGRPFRKKYESELRDGIRKAAHSMPKRQFDEFYGRLHWSFMEKFTIIATSLNVSGAVDDISLVKRLKDARDALTHRGVAAHGELPTEATQQLARKYLRLYYMSQQPTDAERSLAGEVPPVGRSRSKPEKPRRLTKKP